MIHNRFLNASLLAACLVLGTGVQAAEPTLNQVYQAAQAGNFREAQGLMDQVLRDHPNSAKAHFVEAELLAKQGQISGAQSELATAERLDPGLAFAKPGAVQELKARIATPRPNTQIAAAGTMSPAPSQGSGTPWGLILAGAALLGGIVLFLRTRRQNAYAVPGAAVVPAYAGPAGGPQGFGYAPAGPMAAPATGGIGSGIMGGLATGAAVGVGMVAGEALMHRMMDGGHHDSGNRFDQPFSDGSQLAPSQPAYDMGGQDFGVADASSWDDASSGGGGGSDDWS
jgi:uncharacterized protein